MPGIADAELLAQLNAFMRAVVAQWTWDQLAVLTDREHIEERGPDTNPLTFSLSLFENEANADRPYLNVSVSVFDLRHGGGLGSAKAPLCNNFIYYRDGEVDLEELSKFA